MPSARLVVRRPRPRLSALALAAGLALALPASAAAQLPGLAPAARPGEGTPTCAEAVRVMRFAVQRHLVHTSLTPDLVGRARDLFTDALVADHPWLLADDVEALREAARTTPARRILAELLEDRCDFFEAQVERVEVAARRAEAVVGGAGALAALLPARLPSEAPETVASSVPPPADGRALRRRAVAAASAEAWRVRERASWPRCVRFAAGRWWRSLETARAALPGRAHVALLAAFASALDAHSRWLTGEEDARADREREADPAILGLALDVEGPVPGGVRISRVVPGSPAHRAGLRDGDVILAVDGAPLDGLEVDEASDVLDRAPSPVRLRVTTPEPGREPAPRSLTIAREVLPGEGRTVVAEDREVDGRRVIVLVVTSLDASTVRDVERMLATRLAAGPADAVLLDLRGCRGGYLTASAALAGLFLEGGEVTRTVARDGEVTPVEDPTPGAAWRGPLVVLVGRATASGAEIVAGALRARGRAVVVGSDRTFGKGTVQHVFTGEIPVGALYLTTEAYYLPDGTSPQLTGVPSDVVLAGPELPDAMLETAERFAVPRPAPIAPLPGATEDRDPVIAAAVPELRRLVAAGPTGRGAARDARLEQALGVAARFAGAHERAAAPGAGAGAVR